MRSNEAAAVAAALLCLARPAGTALAASCLGDPAEDRIERIEKAGDIRLGSGRVVRLVDVQLPEPPSARVAGQASAHGWLTSLAGQAVTVRAAGEPDRWSREAAAVALADRAQAIDVGEMLIAEGLALVDPGERNALCRPDLLKLEDGARRSRLGLWRDGALVMTATASDGLREAAGRFVVVEGIVVSVGERTGRTYLNFGRDFARDFAVVLPRQTWSALKATGWDAKRLRGTRVRVRGTVEVRRGPVIEISSAEMVERVAAGEP